MHLDKHPRWKAVAVFEKHLEVKIEHEHVDVFVMLEPTSHMSNDERMIEWNVSGTIGTVCEMRLDALSPVHDPLDFSGATCGAHLL